MAGADVDDESTSKLLKGAVCAVITDKDERSIQSKNTSGESAGLTHKTSTPSSQASMPTNGHKKLVSSPNSKCRKMVSKHAKKQKNKNGYP